MARLFGSPGEGEEPWVEKAAETYLRCLNIPSKALDGIRGICHHRERPFTLYQASPPVGHPPPPVWDRVAGDAPPGFDSEGNFPVLETFKKLPAKKQTAILNAAARVFAKQGYYRANVSDICRRARISNGALYKYFKNKEDVFFATLHRTIDLIAEGEARHLPVTKPVFDLVYDLLEEVEAFARENADYIVIYLDLASPSMKAFSDRVSERMETPSRDFWMKIIEEGKRRGEIDRGLSSRIAAYALDNHVMLFMFSCVSPHYARRFDSYFAEGGKEVKREERKRLVVESVRRLLT